MPTFYEQLCDSLRLLLLIEPHKIGTSDDMEKSKLFLAFILMIDGSFGVCLDILSALPVDNAVHIKCERHIFAVLQKAGKFEVCDRNILQ